MKKNKYIIVTIIVLTLIMYLSIGDNRKGEDDINLSRRELIQKKYEEYYEENKDEYFKKMTDDFNNHKEYFIYINKFILNNELDILVEKNNNDILISSVDGNKLNNLIMERDIKFYDNLKYILIDLEYNSIVAQEQRELTIYTNASSFGIYYNIDDKQIPGMGTKRLMDKWFCSYINME